MINIEIVIRSDRIMKAVTGVSVEEFNKLLVTFTEELEKARLSSASIATRCRASGGGQETYLKHSKRETVFYSVLPQVLSNL